MLPQERCNTNPQLELVGGLVTAATPSGGAVQCSSQLSVPPLLSLNCLSEELLVLLDTALLPCPCHDICSPPNQPGALLRFNSLSIIILIQLSFSDVRQNGCLV